MLNSWLILFIILFITCAFFFKAFKKEYLVLALLVFSFSQIVPTFEREDPFFIVDSELIEVDDSQSDNYGFEFISDRLNRTLPWTMFASGYNPNKVELFFGHWYECLFCVGQLIFRRLQFVLCQKPIFL